MRTARPLGLGRRTAAGAEALGADGDRGGAGEGEGMSDRCDGAGAREWLRRVEAGRVHSQTKGKQN
jgi:hypothetical protein